MSVEELFNWIDRGRTLVVITIGFIAGLVYWLLKCRIKMMYQKSCPLLKKLMDASIQFPALGFVLKFAPEKSNFISEQRIVSYLRNHLQISKT